VSHSAAGGGYDAVVIAGYTITITDNDFNLAFAAASSSSIEGNLGTTLTTVTVVLDTSGQTLTSAATVEVFRSGGTATPITDFTFASPETVSFPSGSTDGTTLTVTVTLVGDTNDEVIETVILGL